jgi:predicted phage tail protein
MLTTVRLYGELGRRFGRVHRLDIGSAAEAVRALRVLRPGFAEYVGNSKVMCRFVVNDHPVRAREEMDVRRRMRTLRIVPSHQGAGLELALATFLWFDVGMSLVAAHALAGAIITGLTAVATSLVIGGISQLLFAPPKPQTPGERERPESKPSYAFQGPVNTAQQGQPVPVGYGRLRVGSQVVSAALVTEELPL